MREKMNFNINNNNNGEVNVLPEGCISNILSLTTPRDVCRLSLVSTTFKSAAESDSVWDQFLPLDYRELLDRSDDDGDLSSSPVRFEMKKQIYMRLCDEPLLIDEGRKSFYLEKWSGKKCYMIAARDLTIIWGDTPSYWTWISIPDSRFAEVAELRYVCWLEIRGKINTHILSDATNYSAYMVFMFTSNAHGFQDQPVEVSINTLGVETSARTIYLDPSGERPREYHIVPRRMGLFSRSQAQVLASQAPMLPRVRDDRYPKGRKDGWMEIELGEYYNKEGQDQELVMSLAEVKGGNWKGGIIVQGIEIRPKESK